MKYLHFLILSFFNFFISLSLDWGSQGNGTYFNPILCADFSDPDVIRVCERYYMVASDFQFMGMQILESDDMVNWHILTQVYDRLDFAEYDTMARYAGGSWAPALRYHDGKFWIFFCTPHEGLFMTQAERPEGPWSPLHQLRSVEKWEDPCPFWDEDGQAYLGRSQHGAGPIIVHRMSADGRELLDEGRIVYTGPVAEGTKWLKRNGWYYLSIPEGGVGEGWQTVLRSRNIYGPYEKRVVLEQGSTAVNGPHQGAIVEAADSTWWFYHFQHDDALGRVVHLQPMHWHDDWPVIGVDIDRNGIGEPVYVWRCPSVTPSAGADEQRLTVGKSDFGRLAIPADERGGVRLSPQWQWNHNPVDAAWSLTQPAGALTLRALRAADFMHARNTLTQKVVGYESEVTAVVDLSNLAEGGRCGLVAMGKGSQLLGVTKRDGKLWLYRGSVSIPARKGLPEELTESELCPVKGNRIFLRLRFDMRAKADQFSYSTDGKHFSPVSDPFFVLFGNWKGVRFGIYHYNTEADAGSVTVRDVKYEVLF